MTTPPVAFNSAVNGSQNTMVLAGIYALSDRTSLVGSLPWTNSQSQGNSAGGYSSQSSTSRGSLGNSIGVSQVLFGDIENLGFRVIGNLGTGNQGLGLGQWTSLTVQPQYWIKPALMVNAHVGTTRQAGLGNASGFDLGLVWRATPNLGLVASIQRLSEPGQSGYSNYIYTNLNVSATYHLDSHWSMYASVEKANYSDQNWGGIYLSAYITDNHAMLTTAGVRRSF